MCQRYLQRLRIAEHPQHQIMLLRLLQLLLALNTAATIDWSELNLPDGHLPYFFYNNPKLHIECKNDPNCPFQNIAAGETRCWGYEKDCPEAKRVMPTDCPQDSKWARSKQNQKAMFWKAGDFGVVEEKRSLLEPICAPVREGDSSFECEENARFCRGTHLFMNLKDVEFSSSSYVDNILKSGRIGGHCKLNKPAIAKWDRQHKQALQSWIQVVEDYTSLDFVVNEDNCDIVLEKPTYILQLDAVVNMFHHFCDFVNLYVSQHLNNSFVEDVNIVIWDTSNRGFYDPFHIVWNVFTKHPVKKINSYAGKKVCFNDVIFALPPRQRLGLFYNMPLIDGCSGTGLFRAYNEHTIHRLGVSQDGPLRDKIRITLLSRESKYRNILNEDKLLSALKEDPRYEVRRAVYKFGQRGEDTFLDQVKSTYNSDIFIGMHGAGLTHMLFLPHWATVIEIYHCGDPKCYSTLARLRGVKYMTWTKMDKLYPEDEGHHPTLGAHEKFTNYSFDVGEFVRMIEEAADHVRRHSVYRAARKQLYGKKTEQSNDRVQKDEL